MAVGKPLNQTQVDTALMLVADGRTIRQIAEVIGCHPTTINRILLEMPEQYEAAKEQRRDMIRSERWARAFDRGDRASAKFLDDLSFEQLPETREARKSLNAPSPEEDRSDRIAEALERFTVAVLSRVEQGRAGLPAGEPQ